MAKPSRKIREDQSITGPIFLEKVVNAPRDPKEPKLD